MGYRILQTFLLWARRSFALFLQEYSLCCRKDSDFLCLEYKQAKDILL